MLPSTDYVLHPFVVGLYSLKGETKGIKNFFWLSFPSSLPCPILSSEVPGSFLEEGKLITAELSACIASLLLKFASCFFEKVHEIDMIPTVVSVFALSEVYVYLKLLL